MDPEKEPGKPLPTTYPYVSFAYIKYIWKLNRKVSFDVISAVVWCNNL